MKKNNILVSVLIFLTLSIFSIQNWFWETKSNLNSWSWLTLIYKVPNQDKLDGFIILVKSKRTEFRDDIKYNKLLNVLLEKLNLLASRYKNNSSILSMINYLVSWLNSTKANLEKEILESDLNSKITNSWTIGNYPIISTWTINYNYPNTVIINDNISQPIQNISGNITRSLFLSPSKNVILNSFKVTANYDNIKLKDITITWNWFQNVLNNIRLVDSNMNIVWTANVYSNTNAKFENLNSSSNPSNTININDTSRYYIISDVNSSVDAIWVYANVNISSSSIQWSNWRIINMVWSDVIWAFHDIAQNTFQVTQINLDNKNISSNALVFKINSFGKNEIALSSASITANLWAFNPTSYSSAVVKLYTQQWDFVWSSSLVVNGNEVSWTIPFTNYNILDSNTSTIYKIIFEGLVLNQSVNEYFTVRLNEIITSTGLKASNYPRNTDAFPLISTK